MADNVTLGHPSGKFSVTVDAARAITLRSRGYVSEPPADTKPTVKPKKT